LRWELKERALLGAFGDAVGAATGTCRSSEERASGAVALHVLDVLLGIRDAAESGSAVTIESTVERPAPLPEDFDPAAAVLTA